MGHIFSIRYDSCRVALHISFTSNKTSKLNNNHNCLSHGPYYPLILLGPRIFKDNTDVLLSKYIQDFCHLKSKLSKQV